MNFVYIHSLCLLFIKFLMTTPPSFIWLFLAYKRDFNLHLCSHQESKLLCLQISVLDICQQPWKVSHIFHLRILAIVMKIYTSYKVFFTLWGWGIVSLLFEIYTHAKVNQLCNVSCDKNMIQGAHNKFPDFFRMGTFIDSRHMKL